MTHTEKDVERHIEEGNPPPPNDGNDNPPPPNDDNPKDDIALSEFVSHCPVS